MPASAFQIASISIRRFVATLILACTALVPLGPLSAAPAIELSGPLDYQVFQRGSASSGKIIITGRLLETLKSTAPLEVRLTGPGLKGSWRRIARLTPDNLAFETELEAPAGGWYQLELRLKRRGSDEPDATVAHVGVGEVFVITGQSNSANHGDEKQQPKSGLVTAFSGKRWAPANDPQPGATGDGGSFIPPFADAIAERFKVPVGIIAAGSGGTSVREWLPAGTRFPNPPTVEWNVKPLLSGGWVSKGTLFDNLVKRMKQVPRQGFRAVLWHQGESDANQRDTTRTLPGTSYREYMELLIRESRKQVGWDFPWFVAQVSYHTPTDTGSPDIRAAQAALWSSGVALEGPDTDQMVGDLRDAGGKGIHFSGRGLRAHGIQWANKVSPWLEKQLAKPASKK